MSQRRERRWRRRDLGAVSARLITRTPWKRSDTVFFPAVRDNHQPRPHRRRRRCAHLQPRRKPLGDGLYAAKVVGKKADGIGKGEEHATVDMVGELRHRRRDGFTSVEFLGLPSRLWGGMSASAISVGLAPDAPTGAREIWISPWPRVVLGVVMSTPSLFMTTRFVAFPINTSVLGYWLSGRGRLSSSLWARSVVSTIVH
ncbi:hypothetical protein CGGC5_v016955 [Colletotrichum fructicola Nara gc5]|uniref:Uncharacterized protein n=1 Tax=Colletotrichum fructicola (strain Nara gc5) TaxID=1213859 RepID=A0A7J6IDN1_COLFN|nr:hypothetical protein CGGC5_v016955 [Colletotrichum fructicola Nara gc5]